MPSSLVGLVSHPSNVARALAIGAAIAGLACGGGGPEECDNSAIVEFQAGALGLIAQQGAIQEYQQLIDGLVTTTVQEPRELLSRS